MNNFVLPELVVVDIRWWSSIGGKPQETPYAGAPIAFSISTFAREKADYHLGPFFSSESQLRITRAELEESVSEQLGFGLMDYASLVSSFTFIEIAHWSSDQIERAAEALKLQLELGRFFSKQMSARWGTPLHYRDALLNSASAHMKPQFRAGGSIIRDEWDGRDSSYSYVYRVNR